MQLWVALGTGMAVVYVHVVNACDPNGFQYSLFTVKIKLSNVNCMFLCLYFKGLAQLGFLRVL